MTPSFEVANQIILDIKNDNFDGNIIPFISFDRGLTDEATLIAFGDPIVAQEYLADGITILNSMIFSIREDRYGVDINTSNQLKLIEAGLLNIYQHFLSLSAKIEHNK